MSDFYRKLPDGGAQKAEKLTKVLNKLRNENLATCKKTKSLPAIVQRSKNFIYITLTLKLDVKICFIFIKKFSDMKQPDELTYRKLKSEVSKINPQLKKILEDSKIDQKSPNYFLVFEHVIRVMLLLLELVLNDRHKFLRIFKPKK